MFNHKVFEDPDLAQYMQMKQFEMMALAGPPPGMGMPGGMPGGMPPGMPPMPGMGM